MNRLFIYMAALSLPLLCWPVLGQQSPSQQTNSNQTASPTVHSTAQEVVLDIVFRDKKGRTIHDIRPEQVHIAEDGVEQKVTSFRVVEGTTPAGPEAGPRLDPMREIRLVTLVFEGLDLDGKRFFRQAVKDVLDMTPEHNLYFSILTIDQRLHVVQPFTADHNALLKSIDRSAMWSFIQYQNNSAEVKAELKQIVDQGESSLGSSPGASGGGPSAGAIQGQVNYRMAKMQYDMLQAAEAADREYNARATIDGLMALVRAQSQLPGRKVVIYFNPWLFIPEVVKEQYANLVSAANRANISFYTVDPKGLVTYSQGDLARNELSGATGEIRSSQMRGGVGEVTPAESRAAERAEGALRSNPLLWLRNLADQTGGATIAETNDYRAPLKSAMDEVRTYYEAAYAPSIALNDGKFRKISVRVDRPDVVVHTRSGYFAVPQLKGGQQLAVYEMPLLNALNLSQPPADLIFQAAAERFNDRGPKVEYMVTLEAPLKELNFVAQPDKKNAAVDAALLAVVRNSNGEIVEKFSKDFAVQVPLEEVEARKASGDLVQSFPTELSPGTYSLEAAIMDRNNSKLGVKKRTLVVPEPSNKLSMSDVVVVRRTDPLKDSQILNPFYFPVYPDLAAKEPLKLTMSFYKDGQYLGTSEALLPAICPTGEASSGSAKGAELLPGAPSGDRISCPVNLPADKFAPGAYDIRIAVTQGDLKAENSVSVQVD